MPIYAKSIYILKILPQNRALFARDCIDAPQPGHCFQNKKGTLA